MISPGETEDGRVPGPRAAAVRQPTTMKVDVSPVPGEENTANNSSEYPVIFSLRLAMSLSSTTAAWIAIAAAALSRLRSLVPWLLMRLRRVREAQKVLLGGGRDDLVDFAVSLQGRIDDLHRAVDEVAAGLSARRPARRQHRCEDVDRPLRRLQGHGWPPVGVARAPRQRTQRNRGQRDPGPRLRAHLHEGARPRPRLGRSLSRGEGSGRTCHGKVTTLRVDFPRPCSTFSS